MKIEFQKMRSNLIKHFTEKTKGENFGYQILDFPHIKTTGNSNKHQKHSFESHMRHSNPTIINHRVGFAQDKPIGWQKGRPKKRVARSSKKMTLTIF